MSAMEVRVRGLVAVILWIAVTINITQATHQKHFVSELAMPEDQCVSEFDVVCADCKSFGVCRNYSTGFLVVKTGVCKDDNVCSDGFFEDPDCFLISPSLSPKCLCRNDNPCELDPYDSSGYVLCGDPITYGSCQRKDSFDLTTCKCKQECFECGYFSPGPNATNCASYYSCGNGDWIEQTCSENFCFNADSCTCVETCHECGYIPDPEDPSGFYYCATGSYIPGKCFEDEIFDEDTCICKDANGTTAKPTTDLHTSTRAPTAKTELPPTDSNSVATTTSTTTTTTTTTTSTTTTTTTTESSITDIPVTGTSESDLCAYCGYYSHPSSCSKYYECNEDGSVILQSCPGDLCFDPVNCYCDLPSPKNAVFNLVSKKLLNYIFA